MIWLDKLTKKDYADLCSRGLLTTRKYIFDDAESAFSWFSDNSYQVYLPFYYFLKRPKPNRDWKDLVSTNYTFTEFANSTDDQSFVLNPKKLGNNDINIITAHKPISDIRLVLDGCHRMVALYKYEKKNELKNKINIYEVSGDLVIALFPCDFAHIILQG